MSETVNDSIDMSNPEVAEAVLNDANLRKLPIGSEEFKTAAKELFSKKEAPAKEAIDATVGDESDENESNDSDTEDTDKPVSKKGKGIQNRFDELVRANKELQRRLDQQDNANSRNTQGSTKASEDSTPGDNNAIDSTEYEIPKPKFADYDNLEDYQEALMEWGLDKRDFEREQKSLQAKVKEQSNTIRQSWEQKEVSVRKEFKDYEDFVNVTTLQRLNPTQSMKEFLTESEHGPKVLYTLLSDDEMTEQFMEMSPARQVVFLGKLEDRFIDSTDDSSKEEKKATITKAPAPSGSLPKGKAAATTKSIYDSNLPWDEWNRLMDERERANKRK